MECRIEIKCDLLQLRKHLQTYVKTSCYCTKNVMLALLLLKQLLDFNSGYWLQTEVLLLC